MKQDFSKYQEGEPPGPSTHDGADDVIVSPDTHRQERLPPGQVRTKKWPVLHYGQTPVVERDAWTLDITGLVNQPLQLNWETYQKLPRTKVFSDFHCVTRWSRLGNLWEGVSTHALLELAGGPSPKAKFVLAHGYDDGWFTNIPMNEFFADDALLVDLHDGEPLSADHGGPVRLVIPRLYAWKSAKWLKALEFVASDQPGYWEKGGYHNHGDPWKEQRYNYS